MKYNKRKRLFLVLAIIWMIMIFGFSSRNGDLSGEDSGRVGRLVGEWFVPGFDEWSEVKQNAFVDKVDFPVRKTAHATEYAVLGTLIFGATYEIQRKRDISLESRGYAERYMQLLMKFINCLSLVEAVKCGMY